MPRGRFYEKFEIPAGASGVGTVVHVHHDGDKQRFWRELHERARRRPSWQTRDAGVNLPERVSHEQIRRDARARVYGARRRDQGPLIPEELAGAAAAGLAGNAASNAVGGLLQAGATYNDPGEDTGDKAFRYDRRDGWHERPPDRDRYSDALRSFSDALKRHYRDQGLDETEGDAPLRAFLDWISSHMDPSDWGKPRRDPNRMDVDSVLKYVWPAARPQPLNFKTSSGQRNSSETMRAGSAGFRDSKPKSAADLNALHKRHYAAKGPL